VILHGALDVGVTTDFHGAVDDLLGDAQRSGQRWHADLLLDLVQEVVLDLANDLVLDEFLQGRGKHRFKLVGDLLGDLLPVVAEAVSENIGYLRVLERVRADLVGLARPLIVTHHLLSASIHDPPQR
jgi:hypothetical protein